MCAFSHPYLDCIMRWINLFVVGGVVSNKLYHAVDQLVCYHATTKNLMIHDIHMTFSDFVIDHTASMTNCQISS
jgi:hypothetical protein